MTTLGEIRRVHLNEIRDQVLQYRGMQTLGAREPACILGGVYLEARDPDPAFKVAGNFASIETRNALLVSMRFIE